jgi:hypothetical protein
MIDLAVIGHGKSPLKGPAAMNLLELPTFSKDFLGPSDESQLWMHAIVIGALSPKAWGHCTFVL